MNEIPMTVLGRILCRKAGRPGLMGTKPFRCQRRPSFALPALLVGGTNGATPPTRWRRHTYRRGVVVRDGWRRWAAGPSTTRRRATGERASGVAVEPGRRDGDDARRAAGPAIAPRSDDAEGARAAGGRRPPEPATGRRSDGTGDDRPALEPATRRRSDGTGDDRPAPDPATRRRSDGTGDDRPAPDPAAGRRSDDTCLACGLCPPGWRAGDVVAGDRSEVVLPAPAAIVLAGGAATIAWRAASLRASAFLVAARCSAAERGLLIVYSEGVTAVGGTVGEVLVGAGVEGTVIVGGGVEVGTVEPGPGGAEPGDGGGVEGAVGGAWGCGSEGAVVSVPRSHGSPPQLGSSTSGSRWRPATVSSLGRM
jgi:hypothetical protein